MSLVDLRLCFWSVSLMKIVFKIVLFVQEIYINFGFSHSLVLNYVIIVFTYILKLVYSMVPCFSLFPVCILLCFFFLPVFNWIKLYITLCIIIILVVDFLLFELIVVFSSCSTYDWILICLWFIVVQLWHQTHIFIFFRRNRFLILNLLILYIC